MPDPFLTQENQFDANSFAQGLIKTASLQRERLEIDFKNNLATLWHRPTDEFGEWTLERAQAVLNAVGSAGVPMFNASAFLGLASAIGKASKVDATVFEQANAALMGVLAPYFGDGTLNPADYASPVLTVANPDGTITIDPSVTEYPGPKTQ